ncbi:hypothetical protein B0H16DRAFT_1510294 [Mycena metata]|uniref:DUF6533 domain-containing protein n=1 Tax=Mycena metata TaxID=1033252 RepID=A0AAD7JXM2_9AGAR|nr:hypothetical protein B0H16DRAFT_1510294 [Mycena metata]
MEDDPVSSAREIIVQNHLHVFGLAILYWDHLITLDAEVQYLWGKSKSYGSYLFFAVRYGVPASNIPVAVFAFIAVTPSVSSCARHNLIHQILLITTQILISIIMIQRVYALYDRSIRLLRWLVAVSACLIALSVWLLTNQNSHPLTVLPGCHTTLSRQTSYHLAGGWGTLLIFDAIIFTLTIFNAYSSRKRLGAQARADMPLHTLILRDGALYFAVIAGANLSNIFTFIFDGPIIPGSLTVFTTCISATMVSRLNLNIHENVDADYTNPSEFNMSIFQTQDVGGVLDPLNAESPDTPLTA